MALISGGKLKRLGLSGLISIAPNGLKSASTVLAAATVGFGVSNHRATPMISEPAGLAFGQEAGRHLSCAQDYQLIISACAKRSFRRRPLADRCFRLGQGRDECAFSTRFAILHINSVDYVKLVGVDEGARNVRARSSRCARRVVDVEVGRVSPNGRLKRLKAADGAAGLIEKRQVLDQMHRKGSTDQRCESPLGRFTIQHCLRPEVYDAAIEYRHLARSFLSAKVESRIGIVEAYIGNGCGPSDAKARWLAEETNRIEGPLKKFDAIGFSGLRSLAVYERDCLPESEKATARTLYILARMLKKLGSRGGAIVGGQCPEPVPAE